MNLSPQASILPIAQQGEAILKQPAERVNNPLDPSIQALIQNMLATLLAANGVGLAAPQVYQPLRIIIVASRPNPRYPEAPLMEPVVMINPEISWQSQEQCLGEEGCLSVAEVRGQVKRAERLSVRYSNEAGENIEETYTGFVARIIQHEIDHLNGILFVEHL